MICHNASQTTCFWATDYRGTGPHAAEKAFDWPKLDLAILTLSHV